MRINNLTNIRSEDLRAIVKRVAEFELEPRSRAGVTVHVVLRGARKSKAHAARWAGYTRRTVGPLAPGLRFNQAIIRVGPKSGATEVAMLLAHEFAELRGLDHRAMRSQGYFLQYRRERFGWAAELPLRPKEKAPPTAPDVTRAKKHAHARRMLVLAERRAKRAATIEKKWRAKVRYYERKLAELDKAPARG